MKYELTIRDANAGAGELFYTIDDEGSLVIKDSVVWCIGQWKTKMETGALAGRFGFPLYNVLSIEQVDFDIKLKINNDPDRRLHIGTQEKIGDRISQYRKKLEEEFEEHSREMQALMDKKMPSAASAFSRPSVVTKKRGIPTKVENNNVVQFPEIDMPKKKDDE